MVVVLKYLQFVLQTTWNEYNQQRLKERTSREDKKNGTSLLTLPYHLNNFKCFLLKPAEVGVYSSIQICFIAPWDSHLAVRCCSPKVTTRHIFGFCRPISRKEAQSFSIRSMNTRIKLSNFFLQKNNSEKGWERKEKEHGLANHMLLCYILIYSGWNYINIYFYKCRHRNIHK